MDDGSAPATKADIAALDAKIETGRSSLDEKIEMVRSELNHAYREIQETIRDNQTELLKAFYNYAQSADAKLKEGEVADFLIRGRLTAMESRQTDMERRLNTPPGQ